MNVISSPLHLIERARSVIDVSTLLSRNSRQTGFSPRDFDVDPHTGFFPPEPLPNLPRSFSIWAKALAEAPEVLCLAENESEEALEKRPLGEKWRKTVQSWPILDTTPLRNNIRLLQKAHMVLAFILHFYAHSIPKSTKDTPIVIPRSIAIPLVAVSRELGIAPVLTFADTVLWNWELVNPQIPLSVTNIRYVNLLSGSETEQAFYVVSAAVELKGVEMLQIIEGFMNLPNTSEYSSIAKINNDLLRLKKIVDELTEIFQSIRDTVDPTEFYWLCRPWWSGSESKPNAQPTWVFEGIPDSAKLDLSGPSAGQSTVMHALDVFLDIDHKLLHHHRQPAPSENNKKADRGFMERMRRYMPGKHREYLTRVGAVPCSVREVSRINPSLKDPYNGAVDALKRLRDIHIRIACIYVVTKTNSTPPVQAGIVSCHGQGPEDGRARGTGGNQVSSLLKAGRDATNRAKLPEA